MPIAVKAPAVSRLDGSADGVVAAKATSVFPFRTLVIALVGMATFALLTASSAMGCENEALRSELHSSGLPDCRAYEMVTPPYKEGARIYSFSYSGSGEKAIIGGLGAFAGVEGAGESATLGDLYLAERDPLGWSISPLDAPSSEFIGQRPLAYNANNVATLWEQHTPSQAATVRDLYARSASGAYRLLGPLGPPFENEEAEEDSYILTFNIHYDRLLAATADYGHVLLFPTEQLGYWPFDETVGSRGSLYEYSGSNNSHPILVGVTGEKGSEHLVSRCGSMLGSENGGSVYNALSADGETVFFTAEPEASCGAAAPPTAEIYARKHGSLVSPEAAETVDVSQCGGECGPASGKNFEGASEDGQLVYFTSTQKLTADAVDGSSSGNAVEEGCNNTVEGAGGCNLYLYDFAVPGSECQEEHKCLKLVAGGEVLGVTAIAEDGRRIYYVKRATNTTVDLDVYDSSTGVTTQIATLLNQAGESELWSRRDSRPAEVGGVDGRYLLFASATPGLTADDTSPEVQLFEYDAVTKELVRVTKGEGGYAENGDAARPGISRSSISRIVTKFGTRDFKAAWGASNISNDGKTVVFETTGRLSSLASSAEEGCTSVYEFRTPGALEEGSVHLLSDGVDVQPSPSGCGSLFLQIDETGDNVLFLTSDPLSSEDIDGTQQDVYDARVDGGFALPQAPACAGGCGIPPASEAPGFFARGSSLDPGEAPPPSEGSRPSKIEKASAGAKLVKALRACKAKRRSRRKACERKAHLRSRSATRTRAKGGAR